MSVTNKDIAASLTQLADLLEIEGENPFRIHAYRHAAQMLKNMDRQVADMIADNQSLTALPGIGKALDAKIREIVATGHLAALEREEKHIPPTLRDLLAIPGLGPRRVHMLYERLNIHTIEELAGALDAGRLRTLPGFGDKRVAAISEYLRNRTAPPPLLNLQPSPDDLPLASD